MNLIGAHYMVLLVLLGFWQLTQGDIADSLFTLLCSTIDDIY